MSPGAGTAAHLPRPRHSCRRELSLTGQDQGLEFSSKHEKVPRGTIIISPFLYRERAREQHRGVVSQQGRGSGKGAGPPGASRHQVTSPPALQPPGAPLPDGPLPKTCSAHRTDTQEAPPGPASFVGSAFVSAKSPTPSGPGLQGPCHLPRLPGSVTRLCLCLAGPQPPGRSPALLLTCRGQTSCAQGGLAAPHSPRCQEQPPPHNIPRCHSASQGLFCAPYIQITWEASFFKNTHVWAPQT